MGAPLAPGIMQLLEQEIRSGFKIGPPPPAGLPCSRTIWRAVGRHFRPAHRLGSHRQLPPSWYDHLLRNPLAAPGEAEEFTRLLHKAVRDDPGGLAGALPIICEKLDLGRRSPRAMVPVKSPQEALDVLKQALVEAQTAWAAAVAPLTKSEIRELSAYLYPVLTGQSRVGHTLNDRGTGRRLCELMEKMDRAALVDAAEALVPLTDPKLLAQLKNYPDEGDVTVEGVTGRVLAKIDTPAGAIVIGGHDSNVYQLDEMPGVAAVVDLGGDDEYYEGTLSLERPVLVLIDLAGNDHYKATRPGVQGGAILGVSMLLDLEGNDVYEAQDVAQGSAMAGVGILIDYAGNDQLSGRPPRARRPWAASACSSIAAATTTTTAACGRKASAGPWASACWMTSAATITITPAGCTSIPTSRRRPATKAGDKAWAPASARWPAAASACSSMAAATTSTSSTTSPTAAATGADWASPATSPATTSTSSAARTFTAASGPNRCSNASAAAGAAITPWASASTTPATTSTKARSWAPAWAGTIRWACS